jgi:ring-1,2-phenylacetyl-CoA epoxidase subunit PaaE
LKADAFFICGPEQMIIEVADTLKFFGVAESKIHFELFTTPVLMKAHETNVISNFEGSSKVKVILDSEVAEFELGAKGKTLLEAVEKAGMDAPYSCKGGVCSSCRAKILKGSAMMTSNFSLTDEDIKKGYILTCQAHPTSEELTITFDE